MADSPPDDRLATATIDAREKRDGGFHYSLIGKRRVASSRGRASCAPAGPSRASAGRKCDMGGSDAGNLANGGVLGAALGGQYNSTVTSVCGSASGALTGSASAPTSGTHVFADGGVSDVTGWTQRAQRTVDGTLGVSAGGTSGAFSAVQPSRVLDQMIRIQARGVTWRAQWSRQCASQTG